MRRLLSLDSVEQYVVNWDRHIIIMTVKKLFEQRVYDSGCLYEVNSSQRYG